MIEKIGKITIDDTHYPGEDLYCDGAIEDEILQIVKEKEPSEFAKEIEERKNWPVLYHLSYLRENIVNWIPVKKSDKVLEVGSGCGAITGALSAKAKSVTCVELSKKRSLINAYRHPECDNVTIKLGNFQHIEPELDCDYDYIFLIGVFEYGQSYIGGENPFETFMAIMKKHLAPEGRLVIAIENRLGLKYWAGCQEDHSGIFFDGLEDYPNGGGVRTFTRRALEKICQANEITDYTFYYPYPDYKFMTTVYSDDRLPKVGELSDNLRNFDRDRMLLFDEKNVFDSLIQEGMFDQFSNSYVLVVGKPLDVTYARFSNDRAPQYAIRTEIRENGDGLEVRKIPLTKEAKAHVQKLSETYTKLERAYEGSGLKMNRCHMDGEEAVFEYLDGKTLEELLDARMDKNDLPGFMELFEKYCKYVKCACENKIYNYDLIFSNFIISGETWNLIDYEWVLEQEISFEEIIARALQCYSFGSKRRREFSLAIMKEKMGYDDEKIKEVTAREQKFQKYATGNRMSMAGMRDAIGRLMVPPLAFLDRFQDEDHRNRVQIYEDYGNGFSEENSYFLLKGYGEKEIITVELAEREKVTAVRIDPSLDYCIVQFKEFLLNGKKLSLNDERVKLNGKLISDNLIVFATQDPNITVSVPGQIVLKMEVKRISKEMAESLVGPEEEEQQGTKKGFLWFGK